MKQARIIFEKLWLNWSYDGTEYREFNVALGFYANKESIIIYLLFWSCYISFHRNMAVKGDK